MEIEERAFVDSLPKVAEKLERRDYEKEGEYEIIDRYYCREHVDSMEEVAMDEPGSYGLRIREARGEVELNCKVIENQGDHNAFLEYETEVDSAEEMHQLLEAVGFKNFCTVRKKRTEYVSPGGDITVNLEDLEDFAPVIELEIIAEEDIEEKKQLNRELLYDLGVEDEEIIDKSITLLYFRENAF